MFVKLTYHSTDAVVYVNLNEIVKIQVNRDLNSQEYLTVYMTDGSHFNVNENSADIASKAAEMGVRLFR